MLKLHIISVNIYDEMESWIRVTEIMNVNN